MVDVSSILIEMHKLLRETYENFNDRKYEDALAAAETLKSAAAELVREMQQVK